MSSWIGILMLLLVAFVLVGFVASFFLKYPEGFPVWPARIDLVLMLSPLPLIKLAFNMFPTWGPVAVIVIPLLLLKCRLCKSSSRLADMYVAAAFSGFDRGVGDGVQLLVAVLVLGLMSVFGIFVCIFCAVATAWQLLTGAEKLEATAVDDVDASPAPSELVASEVTGDDVRGPVILEMAGDAHVSAPVIGYGGAAGSSDTDDDSLF